MNKPQKRTPEEIRIREVADRLLGREKCCLGYCVTHNSRYSGPLNKKDWPALRDGVCPKCGFPWVIAPMEEKFAKEIINTKVYTDFKNKIDARR